LKRATTEQQYSSQHAFSHPRQPDTVQVSVQVHTSNTESDNWTQNHLI